MSYFKTTALQSSAGVEALIGAFGELLVGTKKDDLNLKFIYPFYNTDFDLNPAVLVGDGAVVVEDALLKVSSAETGSAFVSSKNSIRYRSGHTGYADFTLKVTGSTGKGVAGCVDETEGFFVQYDNDTARWGVGRRKADIDFITEEIDFNGNAPISILDPTKINIFRVVFGYLGIANPLFLVKIDKWYVLHQIKTENVLDETTVGNPNFPISIYAENGAEASTASWCGGVIDGGMLETGARYFDEELTGTLSGTDLKTLGTWHNKAQYKGVANKVKAQLLRYKFLVQPPESGTGTVRFKIIKNAVLSGTPEYADLDADNSVLEVDVVQTYSSGGKSIFTDYVSYSATTGGSSVKSGGDSQLPAIELGLFLLPNETAVITAQNVQGTTNVVVRAVFNHIELF